MPSSDKHSIPFFLVLIISATTFSLSSHIAHARDFESFNKIPSTTTNQEQPSFLPQNDESYGLYGHESGKFPPSTTTTGGKHLPKNYNPVAYVTVPENTNGETSDDEFTEQRSFSKNPNTKTSNYDEAGEGNSYYNNDENQQREEYFSEYRDRKSYNRLGSDFNSPREAKFISSDNENVEGLKPQGRSDTRFLENGMYHYDVSTGRFSSNHPYERLKGGVRRGNGNDLMSRNYNRNYGNRMDENVFQNENEDDESDQFRVEDSNMP